MITFWPAAYATYKECCGPLSDPFDAALAKHTPQLFRDFQHAERGILDGISSLTAIDEAAAIARTYTGISISEGTRGHDVIVVLSFISISIRREVPDSASPPMTTQRASRSDRSAGRAATKVSESV